VQTKTMFYTLRRGKRRIAGYIVAYQLTAEVAGRVVHADRSEYQLCRSGDKNEKQEEQYSVEVMWHRYTSQNPRSALLKLQECDSSCSVIVSLVPHMLSIRQRTLTKPMALDWIISVGSIRKIKQLTFSRKHCRHMSNPLER